MSMKKNSDLSFSGILFIGLLLSAIISGLTFGVMRISHIFSPNIYNAEKLLKKGKLNEAAALADRIKGDDYACELIKGKIFLGFALERMKKSGWNFYGTDPGDWLKGGDADSALVAFKRAQKIRPEKLPAFFYAGIVCKEKGWYRRAEDELLRAVDIDSTDISTRMALGSLYALQENYKEAEQQLRIAAEFGSKNPDILKNLAFLYRFYLHHPESAAVYFSRYLSCAEPGDLDIQRAETELNEIRHRYPEFTIPETPIGGKRAKVRHFTPRN